jgi:putative FmdB family regulatory protein
MPIYEYRCDNCEREFEVKRRITDPPLGACPKCRSRKLRRLISQTSFVLKGGGWYSDLYSSKSKSTSESTSKEGGGEAGGSKEATASEKADATPSKGGEDPGGKKGKKGKKSESKSKSAA